MGGLLPGCPGDLGLAPDAPAYGTKVRWIAPRLVAAANEQVPGANVRVLASASVKAGLTTAADLASSPPAPAAPAPRPAPSAGYRRALEAHRQAM